MKRWISIFAILLSLLLFDRGSTQAADVNFTVSFGDSLTPYGSWVTAPSYGRVWYPRASGYVPYTNGHWSYTSYGPTWVGADDWSWATDHYGHWVYTTQYGWTWVPGYEYTPGRVAWSYGSNYIGWAPYWSGLNYSNPAYWTVIDRNHFGYQNYSSVRLGRDRVRDLFDRRVVRAHSGRMALPDFERVVGRKINVVRVTERQIDADRHRTRIVIPDDDVRILKRVSIAHQNRVDADKKIMISKKVQVKNTPVNQRVEISKKTEIKREPTPRNVTISKKTEVKKSDHSPSVSVKRDDHKKTVLHSQQKSHVTQKKVVTQNKSKSTVHKPATKVTTHHSMKSKVTSKPQVKKQTSMKSKQQHNAPSKQGNKKRPH